MMPTRSRKPPGGGYGAREGHTHAVAAGRVRIRVTLYAVVRRRKRRFTKAARRWCSLGRCPTVLQPPEDLLDAFAAPPADSVSGVPRDEAIDDTVVPSVLVVRNMGLWV